MGQRSQALLFALAFIAAANGLLLALSLYGLLAAALHLVGDHAPGIGWGLLAGAIGAIALLVRAFTRAAQTRKLLYGRSLLDYEVPARTDLVARLTDLHGRSKLPRAPSLRLVGGELPNAYTVARSPEEAAIVLTDGLLARLGPVELEAVIAHALAQIENEDIVTVGVADAVAVSIEELSRLKGRFFWGPREILTDILPFLGAMAALAIVDALLPKDSSNTLVILAFVVLLLGLFRVLWRAALVSWRGLAQLTLFALFFGPLTLVEWVLAPPTAYVLSRLFSRERVIEADRRAVELTRNRAGAQAALRNLEGVEYTAGEPFWAALRYSLFVTPRAQTGLGPWRERVFGTHPPVAARIEQLGRLTQDGSRRQPIPDGARDPLEQSG